ncbi:MAG: hypothetical protein ACREDO_00120 [Methyloceanibacter sp.]
MTTITFVGSQWDGEQRFARGLVEGDANGDRVAGFKILTTLHADDFAY